MWRNLFQNRRAAIKEGGDNLPMGLCFAAQSGNVLFLNRMMESLSYRLIGESLQNATYFWDRIADGNLQNGIVCEKRPELTKENQYLIRFANGECRTFTRSILELDGEEIVEITSADTTDLYGLLCEQERKNKSLFQIRKRLQEYQKQIVKVARDEELLQAKMRFHDELGRTLMQTRRALLDDKGEDAVLEALDS